MEPRRAVARSLPRAGHRPRPASFVRRRRSGTIARPMSDSTFPDLRAFLDVLRRQRRPRRGRGPGGRAPGGGGDPPARDRRRRARPALHERPRRGLPAGHEPLRHRGRAPSWPSAAGPMRLVRRLVELAADAPAADAAASSGAPATCSAQAAARRHAPAPRGPGAWTWSTSDVRLDRLPVLTCWPEDGGPFLTLPLVYTEHPQRPGHNLGIYRMQVHDPRTTGMHWQIGKGGGFHYAVAEARGRGPARDRLPRRPAGAHPGRHRAAARERARADAGLAHRRASGSTLAAGPGPHPLVADAEFALVGDVPPARAPARGPVRRPLRLLLAPARLSRVRGGAHSPAAATRSIRPPSWASRARRTSSSATSSRSCSRRSSRWSCPASESLWSLRRDRLPLAGRGGRQASATSARPWPAPSASWARASSRSRSSCSLTDQPVDLQGLPRHARARPGAHAPRDRPLRLLEPVHGHARLHRPAGQRGLEGRLARPGRSGARAAPRVPPPASSPPGVTDVRVFCRGCLVVGGPPLRRASRGAARPARRASRLRGLAAARAHGRAARAPRAAP